MVAQEEQEESRHLRKVSCLGHAHLTASGFVLLILEPPTLNTGLVESGHSGNVRLNGALAGPRSEKFAEGEGRQVREERTERQE